MAANPLRSAAALFLLILSTAALAKPAQLVLDINQGASSGPSFGFSVGGVALFSANDGTGLALWRSDGTRAGTQKLGPGAPVTSRFGLGQAFVRLGNAVIYTGYTPAGSAELWRTDGTAAGTSLLLDMGLPFIAPFAAEGSVPASCGVGYMAVGNQVFYGAPQRGPGKLFRTDGTPAGTVEISQFSEGVCVLGAFDGNIYFSLYNPQTGVATLWRSNGQAGGHTPVLDANGVQLPPPTEVVEMNGAGYFTLGSQGVAGLWRLTKDDPVARRVVPRTWTTWLGGKPSIAGVMGNLLLIRDDEVVESALVTKMYRSDGTADGTFALSPAATTDSLRAPGIQLGNRYVYAGPAEATGFDLWVTDGTAAGTTATRIPTSVRQTKSPMDYILFDGKAYFGFAQGVAGVVVGELWRTDGTPSGTERVTDVSQFDRSAFGAHFAVAGNRLLFAASTEAQGFELWALEGSTSAGTSGGGLGSGDQSSGGGGATTVLDVLALIALALVITACRRRNLDHLLA